MFYVNQEGQPYLHFLWVCLYQLVALVLLLEAYLIVFLVTGT